VSDLCNGVWLALGVLGGRWEQLGKVVRIGM